MVNSRLDLFTATHSRGHPFFRSYGAILPSSLERVISRPLVFSTSLPVSVSGTGNFGLTCHRAFLGSLTKPLRVRRPSYSHLSSGRFLRPSSPRVLEPVTNIRLAIAFSVPLHFPKISTGLLTRCPSTTPFGLALGPD